MLLLIFFAFLHCWLNAFAEMLRFGDRMFYRVGPGPRPVGSWRQGGLGRDLGKMVARLDVTSAMLFTSHNKKCSPLDVVIMPRLHLLTSQG